jgi:pyruvate-ferredoxin/flavodoxin oxidoreductase
MASLKNTAIRLYRRFFGSPTAAADHAAGIEAVLRGDTAIAISEATISQEATLSNLTRSSWAFNAPTDMNTFGQPIATLQAESARGALSAAIGLTLSGRRATTFLDGQDIAAVQDLMYSASGRHLPLVVHLSSKALAAQGVPTGSGHEGFYLSADSGFFTLFATNVQEALDFTYIARRIAEQCLVPGLVAMDAEQTATSYQNVHLLAPEQIQVFLGPAEDKILVPNVAQRLLFGRTRRRVPRWHDVDRPALQGAVFDRDTYALGALGRTAFFDEHLPASFTESFEYFETLTGRSYARISEHNLSDARLVLVAQGSAVETARAAADHLRKNRRFKVGVVGISTLRPFPTDDIKKALNGCESVVVLERALNAPGSQGLLTREISAVISGLPKPPRCHSAVYGIGGAPLRIIDLLAIPDSLPASTSSNFVLGTDFMSPGENHPKREILLDSLHRAYPGLDTMGVRASPGTSPVAVQDSLSIAFFGEAGDALETTVRNTSQLLHQLDGGFLRTRLKHEEPQWHGLSEGIVIHGDHKLMDPGDDTLIDVLVLTDPAKVASIRLADRLHDSSVVLMMGPCHLELPLLEVIESKQLRIFRADAANDPEEVTGATFGAIAQSGLSDQSNRRIATARQALLKNVDTDEPDALMARFQSAMDACTVISVEQARPEAVQPARWDGEKPITARIEDRGDNEFDSLPRFWDQQGVFFHDNERELLTVDPYFASGTMAPLSSTFRNLSEARTTLPVLDPHACTGCGKCWTACPDSAIGAVALSPVSIIDTGMRAARGAEALRQITNQLGARISSQAKKRELASTAGEALRTEFAWVKEKMSLTPDREDALDAAISDVSGNLDALPLIVTDTFFNAPESAKKDSGELLSLAINPDACKGCGICVEVCEPLALSVVEQDQARIERVRQGWNTWAMTPDTPAATIERVIENGSLNALEALNLSRYCLHAMAGGDSAEKFAHDAREKLAEVVARIQAILSAAMPGEDIETLHGVLEQIQGPRATLTDLAQEVDKATKGRNIDTMELRQLTHIAEELSELASTISEGNQGLGRARYGLALTPGSVSRWAAEFPYNSFHAPVVVDVSGETAQMAAGLLEGHLRDTCESIATLRRADIEMERPSGIQFERDAVAHLGWRDLSADERKLCPPLLLVGGDDIIAGAELSQVLWLLCTELPIKIVTFADMDLGLTGEQAAKRHHDPRINLGLVSLAARNAYIAQTSIAETEHLYQAVSEALAYPGPALLRIHTPSPGRHGVATADVIEQARIAFQSRAIPLFTYDPRIEGVHGKRLSLDGNPDPGVTWQSREDGSNVTPADWAVREARFRHHFTLAREAEGTLVSVNELLSEPAAGRRNKTAVVDFNDESFAISDDMMTVIEEMQASWQVLQELGGLVTPFTETVEERVREDVAGDHEKALEELRSEYDQKIAELTANVQQDVAAKIRGQLVNLVNMAPPRARAEIDTPDE